MIRPGTLFLEEMVAGSVFLLSSAPLALSIYPVSYKSNNSHASLSQWHQEFLFISERKAHSPLDLAYLVTASWAGCLQLVSRQPALECYRSQLS